MIDIDIDIDPHGDYRGLARVTWSENILDVKC